MEAVKFHFENTNKCLLATLHADSKPFGVLSVMWQGESDKQNCIECCICMCGLYVWVV